jgi:type II secretory pathway component PulF
MLLLILLAIMFIVPRYEARFEELDVRLPIITRYAISLARGLRRLWFLLPFGFAGVVAADAVAFVLLTRAFRSRLPRFLYSSAVTLVLAFLVVATILALFVPLIHLMHQLGEP